MPKFLESVLKDEYGSKSSTPYKVMNKMGVMRGSEETPKGKAMQRKHDEDSTESTNRSPSVAKVGRRLA